MTFDLQLDGKGTLSGADDVYVRTSPIHGTETVTFAGFASVNDGLGAVRKATAQTSKNRTETLELYDDIAAAAGGLNYIQLGRASGAITDAETGDALFALTTPDPFTLPKTGSATYAGETRGRLVTPGSGANYYSGPAYNVRGTMQATVNFSAGEFRGTAFGFQAADENGAAVTLPTNIDFGFSGFVYPSQLGGGAEGLGTISGPVGGRFAGMDPSGQPAELAITYAIYRTFGLLYGVGGLKRTGGN